MKIRNLMEKSSELFVANKKMLIVIFLYIAIMHMLVNEIGSMLGSLFGLVAIFIAAPLNHGRITASYKVIKQDAPLDVRKDGLCGFIRFKELFSTYGWIELINLILLYIVLFGALMLIVGQIDVLSLETSLLSGNVDDVALYRMLQIIVLVTLVVDLVVRWLTNLFFFAAPYLLETQQIRGIASLRASMRLMHGHKWELIRLQLQFLAPAAICFFLNYLSAYYLSSVLYSFVGLAITLLGVYLYQVQYQLALVLFYEQIKEGDKQ